MNGHCICNLLVIEDDRALREGLALVLSSEQLNIHTADSIETAWIQVHTINPDIVLLDMNLPDGTGISFCKKYREISNAPVIFLTVCDTEIETVSAFRVGATDYVTKPFSTMVLKERIFAALRQYQNHDVIYDDGIFYFNFTSMIFKHKSATLFLSMTEQKILRILIENKGNIVTRQSLLEHIWDCDSEFVDDNALTVAVKRLRVKLEIERIKTAYGLGYYWSTSVDKEGEA